MDESLAHVVVDFSGRPYCVYLIVIGTHQHWVAFPSVCFLIFLKVSPFRHACNLHISVPYGKDDHHQAEAIFKAFARALTTATRIDARRSGNIPSSKGILF